MFSTRYYPAEDTPINRMILVMGNMIALIQVILVFAAIDIFLYNVYEIKLIPLWIFALIVMALGGLVLGFLFVQTIRQYSRQHSNISRE
jgi:ABC-type polysaccharide/polyol phosphate export permease